MTDKHPFGPDLSKHYAGDLSGLAYFSLIDIMHDTGIDETEIFDEGTLAKALRGIAADGDEYVMSHALREIADALDHPKAEVGLKIAKPKRGRSLSFAEREERDVRTYNIAATVFAWSRETGQVEAAVAKAREDFKVSRATVFRALATQAKEQKRLRELALKLPSADDLIDDETRQWSREFGIWLDRYLNEPPADEG